MILSSSIQIRSEDLSVLGNHSTLLFQCCTALDSEQPATTPNQPYPRHQSEQSPRLMNGQAAIVTFMFEVTNSTFSVLEVHAVLNSEGTGICSIVGSTVRFSSSTISSNGLSSPFLIRTSENAELTFGSRVILSDVTHLSNSDHLPPLVGIMRSPTSLPSPPSPKWSASTTSLETATIIGTGISIESKHLFAGTGLLFSFGLSEHESSLPASGHAVHMETNLLQSSLVNVSSSSAFSPSDHLFGSEVSQRVVGSCVEMCTNHDSGTGMMSPNMGGNLVCLNTSFSSCVRERNKVLEFSFENRTQDSEPGRLKNVTSDVTSVSFTLCTFSEMAISSFRTEGGAAIFLKLTSSSLTVKQCFFRKCTDDGESAGGGAIHFWCESAKKRPITVSDSSFTECYTDTSEPDGSPQAGCIKAYETSSATIERCFFELSYSTDGGALYVRSSDVTFSNSAFVECSSAYAGGGISISNATTASFSFLQFRGCSSRIEPQGRDITTGAFRYSKVTPDTFQFCDSTSGSPNVYFDVDEKKDSMLVPQITSTPTITSVDVSFSGSEATVTVETDIAIKGTLGVLLNGSNVPRLVHVVFGEPTVVSKVGTAVVSCGSNGVLPIDTTYIEHKWTLAPFPRPAIHTLVSADLEDSNTLKIVLSGVRIYEGTYWMPIGNAQFRRNVTLTRSGSDTLIGRAPLHPSTAPERLEWSMRYMVNRVYWRLPDGVSEEEAVLTKTFPFTTPDAPIRITDASCSLEEDKQKSALVTLTGMKLGGDKDFNITVRKMDGSSPSGSPIVLSGKLSGASSLTSHTLSVLIFGATNPPLSFGATYVITEFDVDGSVSVVDAGVTFDVPPEPPRITGVESRRLTNDLSKMIIVLEGRALNSRTGKVNLTDGTKTWESLSNVVIVDSTHCTADFGVGEAETVGLMKYGSSYTLKGSWTESNGFHVEAGITVTIPDAPLITSITCPRAVTTPSFVLTVSGSDLPSGKTFTVTLTTGHTFEISFSSETAGRSGDIAIGGAGEVQYGTGYTIKSIIRKVSGQEDELILFPSTPFTTPHGPTLSLISCDFDLSNPNFVKVELTTMNMPSEAFTLTLTTTAAPIEIVELSVSSASISSGLIVVEVYNKTQTLKYGRSYSVSGMRSSSVIAFVSAPSFSTPDAPIRVTNASCSLGEEIQTSALVTLTE